MREPQDWDWQAGGTGQHGGRALSLPQPPCTTHLDFLVQQLQGQVLKRDAGPGVEAGLAEEAGDISGVPGLAPRVDVLEGLEVIVQGVPHQHLALQELEDL